MCFLFPVTQFFLRDFPNLVIWEKARLALLVL
jgi:hypothetical protein